MYNYIYIYYIYKNNIFKNVKINDLVLLVAHRGSPAALANSVSFKLHPRDQVR
jgi:hypothetical protein